MAEILHYQNLLRDFYNAPTHKGWSKDLVCKVIQTNGNLCEADDEFILNEIENGIDTPSLSFPTTTGSSFPRVRLKRLVHVHGVNALMDNQPIDFCYGGHTILFGLNGSGKSSYFRILNQLCSGSESYVINGNIYNSGAGYKKVEIDYLLDNNPTCTFNWNCLSNTLPRELHHVRFFDNNYAEKYLHPLNSNHYVFQSYNLNVFKCIISLLDLLKAVSETPLGQDETDLRNMCSSSYSHILAQTLEIKFQEEVEKFGMDYLQVSLHISDLMNPVSNITLKITNTYDVNKILSEAELKCCSLALFFAEYELLPVQQTLVFDDPVNSLDTKIIQKFADRIAQVNSQVILFTHNVQLLNLLVEKDGLEYKIYENLASIPETNTSSKIYVLIYDILSEPTRYTGLVKNHTNKKSIHILNDVVSTLNNPTPLADTRRVVDDMRISIEWMIDEVVFRNLNPLKFRGRSSIPWKNLELMVNTDGASVLELKSIYDALSNSGLHVGYGGLFSPLSKTQLLNFAQRLIQIFNNAYP
jgi:energy-coupling factor transporter ATP-binding protein EcfA2